MPKRTPRHALLRLPSPTRVVIYTRVSTAQQADEGVSLSVQLERATQLADQRDLHVVAHFQDAGLSGTDKERPGLLNLMAYVAANPDTAVVVYSLSRLGRSLSHLADLIDGGLQIISVTEPIDTTTAAGRMFVGMLAVFSQFERDLIAERTAGALAKLQSDGKHVGRPPFGWRVSESTGELEKDPELFHLVRYVFQLRAAGYTYEVICERLNAGGQGGPWHEKKLQRILKHAPNLRAMEIP